MAKSLKSRGGTSPSILRGFLPFLPLVTHLLGNLGYPSVFLRLSFGYPSVILRLSFVYPSVILRISFGYPSVILRLSFGYPTVILRLSFGYLPVISIAGFQVLLIKSRSCIHTVNFEKRKSTIMYSLQCTVYSVQQCTVYSVQYAECTIYLLEETLPKVAQLSIVADRARQGKGVSNWITEETQT